ncbi:uncharacterized protein LOC142497266 isoform X2 [Ascaphus truei]|uniref:uncharacterized protein LOC142497266 isoform X2 n=1 Tax=Ascaphus truei TaxID=8439 RepID=UPI003F5A11DA
MVQVGRHACSTGGGPPVSLHLQSYEQKMYYIMDHQLVFGIGGDRDIGPTISQQSQKITSCSATDAGTCFSIKMLTSPFQCHKNMCMDGSKDTRSESLNILQT